MAIETMVKTVFWMVRCCWSSSRFETQPRDASSQLSTAFFRLFSMDPSQNHGRRTAKFTDDSRDGVRK